MYEINQIKDQVGKIQDINTNEISNIIKIHDKAKTY